MSAGYIDAISSDKRDVFVDMVRNYIERIGAENLPVIHRYSIVTAEIY